MNQIQGQMTIEEYVKNRVGVSPGCSGCVCQRCLYWWSGRCPYGGCWDDHRAQVDPYDRAHPDKPPRRAWSNWDAPGEQAHWCRGGIFYPIYFCQHFAEYEGQTVKGCLKENVSIFQDGYIRCGLVDSLGCEKCYEDFMEKEAGE